MQGQRASTAAPQDYGPSPSAAVGCTRLDQPLEEVVIMNATQAVGFILTNEDDEVLPAVSHWHIRALIRGG